MKIRPAEPQDIPQLFELMKQLAVFEQYIDSFAITPDVVKQRGFEKNPLDFYSLVADDDGMIAGMLVYYVCCGSATWLSNDKMDCCSLE